MRGTTRDAARCPQIEAAGAESVVADPDRLATLITALDHVSVAVILLGSASGGEEMLSDLHGPRLEALARRMIDTTIHGVVYEARGSVDPALLGAGAELIRAFGADSRARIALLTADPSDPEAWLRDALGAVEEALGER